MCFFSLPMCITPNTTDPNSHFVAVMGFLFAAVCLMLLSNAQCVAAYNKDAIINHKKKGDCCEKTFLFLAITFFPPVPPKAKI